jgi:AraC family transcriptional regulator
MKMFTLLLLITFALSAFLYADEAQTAAQPREEKLDDMMMAGVVIMDPANSEDYSKAWEKFFQVSYLIQNTIGEEFYGVTYYTEDYSPAEGVGQAYMVCTQVKSLDDLPEGVSIRKIPAANYLVFEHQGSMEKVGETYNYIYNVFLADSDYTVLYRDTLERYDHRFMADPDEAVFEIWIPVQGKQ